MEQNVQNWELVHSGDKEAREQMILDNMGLVRAVAGRYRNWNVPQEDLIQIGTIGLIKAIDRFETSYEVCFSTYAVPLIMGEIKRFFRDDGIVKVSRTIKENSWKLAAEKEKLLAELGREPTIQELSERTGITEEDAVLAIGALGEIASLNEPVFRGDGKEILLADQIESNSRDEEKLLDHFVLKEAVEELTQEEQKIIYMRYFQECTQSQVAEQLGVSQVKISRLEKKILFKMKEYISKK